MLDTVSQDVDANGLSRPTVSGILTRVVLRGIYKMQGFRFLGGPAVRPTSWPAALSPRLTTGFPLSGKSLGHSVLVHACNRGTGS